MENRNVNINKCRCKWCNLKNIKYVEYHDQEWGIPQYEDSRLFELLILESFQAGLSWECVLNKRENFRKAFDDFDLETMVKGYDAIKAKMNEIIGKGYSATNKELSVLETLKLSLEATARGFKFGNIDIEKSDGKNFIIGDDHKTLICPFRTLDGLGDSVAKKIIEERNIKPFYSIEDFSLRGHVNGTTVDKLRSLGVFGNLPETSQLSLFDFV